MGLTTLTLNTTQSQTQYVGINDLVNQLINALTSVLTGGGMPYTVIYDNNAGLSPTVLRVWVAQIGGCPHYIQIQSTNATNFGFGPLKLANSIPNGTFTVQTGYFATYYWTATLQNRIVNFICSPSTFLIKSEGQGIAPVFLLSLIKCTDGQIRCVCYPNAILPNDADVTLSMTSPVYGAITDGNFNSPIIPSLVSTSGTITSWQPTKLFGVTLTSQYSMFHDAAGVYYYYSTYLLTSE